MVIDQEYATPENRTRELKDGLREQATNRSENRERRAPNANPKSQTTGRADRYTQK